MEISTNSNIYLSITSLKTPNQKKNVEETSNLTENFTVPQSLKTTASDYTIDEYKSLSTKNINELFPWDKMPNENEKAHKLKLLSTLSPDNTLNEVLFDKAKNSDFNDISTRNFFDRTLASAELEKALISAHEYDISKEGIESFKEGLINSVRTLSEEKRKSFLKEEGFNSLDEYIKNTKNAEITLSPLEKEIDGIVDAKSYFQFYQTSKDYFAEYGKDLSEYSQKYLPAEFTLFDNIKDEYQKRISQNETILNQLTKNGKPNPLKIYA